MNNQPTRFIKLLESKKIKYVDLDNINTNFKKPDFIISKNAERLIIELKEISYTPKEIAQSNLLNNLIKQIKKLDFQYVLHLNLNDKFELNNKIIKAIQKILKLYKKNIDSTEIDFQILVPENFNIKKIIEYEIYSQKDEIINKTITYKINDSYKIPFKFKNDNLHCIVKLDNKKINLLNSDAYKLIEFSDFIFSVKTIKKIKIKGMAGPSKVWWVNQNLLKDKLLYQIKKSNRQFKEFKRSKKNLNNLETLLIISISNIYLNNLIDDRATLNEILSDIFSKESFSAISRVSFFENEKIINSFQNNNYCFENNLRKRELIKLLES